MGIFNGAENRAAMQELFLFLAQEFDIGIFVETGTYQGATAEWASSHFSRVITIEGSEGLYQDARKRLADHSNVECRWGDSRKQLPILAREITDPTMFWLDAHWSGGNTFGEHNECPLIDELVAIYDTGEKSFVIIDDARLFTSLPPLPHDIHGWPSYFDIADTVRRRASDTFITIHADAILLAPGWTTSKLIPFLRKSSAASHVPPPKSFWSGLWDRWRKSA